MNEPPVMSKEVNANELRQTFIDPVLTRPLEPDKNHIWCASYQLSWNNLKKITVVDPVKPKPLITQLNKSKVTENNLDPKTYFTGIPRDFRISIGINEKEMQYVKNGFSGNHSGFPAFYWNL